MERHLRTSTISRILGGSEQERSILAQEFVLRFQGSSFRYPEERVKSMVEKGILLQILEYLPLFLSRFGAQALPLSTGHFHFLKRSRYNQLKREANAGTKEEAGTWNSWLQVLMVGWEKPELLSWHRVVHEAIHAYAFQSYEIKNGRASQRRGGLGLCSSKGNNYITYFAGFDEAITEELAMRFEQEFFPLIRGLDVKVSEVKRFVQRMDLDDDVVAYRTYQKRSGMYKTSIHSFAYYSDRRRLEYCISKIWENHASKFSSCEEVFALFARATLSGHLLPLWRAMKPIWNREERKRMCTRTATSNKLLLL